MIFRGNRVRASEALAIGLVNSVMPDADLLDGAMIILKEICRNGPFSVRLVKSIIDAGFDVDLNNACRMELDAFALCFSTNDQDEGMGAFLEKRAPRFQGR